MEDRFPGLLEGCTNSIEFLVGGLVSQELFLPSGHTHTQHILVGTR